jgi:hypothetical protein
VLVLLNKDRRTRWRDMDDLHCYRIIELALLNSLERVKSMCIPSDYAQSNRILAAIQTVIQTTLLTLEQSHEFSHVRWLAQRVAFTARLEADSHIQLTPSNGFTVDLLDRVYRRQRDPVSKAYARATMWEKSHPKR